MIAGRKQVSGKILRSFLSISELNCIPNSCFNYDKLDKNKSKNPNSYFACIINKKKYAGNKKEPSEINKKT